MRLAYVDHTNRATNTPVTIHTPAGAKTVRINQRKRPPIDGMFRSLGTFALDAKSAVVVTNAGTDGYVVVDALQLIPAR